jgi:hypothetical protein
VVGLLGFMLVIFILSSTVSVYPEKFSAESRFAGGNMDSSIHPV